MSSKELSEALELSKTELQALKSELSALREHSTGLLVQAETSKEELTALRRALTKAENSLENSKQSFAAYKQSVELQIAGLERRVRFWKWGGIIAAVLAVGGWTAFVVTAGR